MDELRIIINKIIGISLSAERTTSLSETLYWNQISEILTISPGFSAQDLDTPRKTVQFLDWSAERRKALEFLPYQQYQRRSKVNLPQLRLLSVRQTRTQGQFDTDQRLLS